MNSSEIEFNSLCNARISEAINQANAMEFEIDDILAGAHFRKNGEAFSEQSYLDYVGGHLQGNSLSRKCNDLLELSEAEVLIEAAGMRREDAAKTMSAWRASRNRFAHGLLVINSSSDKVLYHKGCCYDVGSHVDEFFDLNAKVLGIMGAVSSLHTEHWGKPALREEGGDPDHPVVARAVRPASSDLKNAEA